MALFKSPEIAGAGVSKDSENNYRGFVKFFSKFKRAYGKLLSAGLISCLFNIIFPVSGLGAVGLARVSRLAVRDRHFFISDYFDTIKKNLTQALFMGIINVILTGGTAFAVYYIYNDPKGTVNFILLAVAIAAFILANFLTYYTPFVLITFNVSMGELYKNALILSFMGFLRSFSILLLHILTYLIVLFPLLIDIYVGAGISICLYIILVPPMRAYITAYHVYPVMYKYMIKPFMEKNPDAKSQTLIELGLVDNDTESVMSDDIISE